MLHKNLTCLHTKKGIKTFRKSYAVHEWEQPAQAEKREIRKPVQAGKQRFGEEKHSRYYTKKQELSLYTAIFSYICQIHKQQQH